MATSLKVAASSDGPDADTSGRRASYQKPRLLLDSDAPWMNDLGRRRYSNQYDFMGVEMWYRNIVLKSPMVFYPVRTDNAFLICMISTTPWAPQMPEANVCLVCAEEGAMWEAIVLLRSSIEWAKRRKCSLWRVSSETGFDLEPIARKLGATEPNTRWVKRFDV